MAVTIISTSLRAMRGWHRPLMVNVILLFTLALVSGVGVLVDDRLTVSYTHLTLPTNREV